MREILLEFFIYIILPFALRRIDTLSREATLNNVCLVTEKGFSLKGNNLLPMGANSFPLK